MDTLYYSQLDEPNLEQIQNDIIVHNPKTIVLFCETEWDSRELTQELADLVNAHNIHVQVTFCSFPSEYYKEKTDKFNSIELIHWPTYWVNWTMMCSSHLDFNVPYTSFDYPFICLNNKNHLHRCMLIDQLSKNNLLDTGIVTWHRFPNRQPSDHIYKFKYYDDSIRLIGDDFITKLDSFLIPEEYHKSFLHVIGEATLKVTCISEKTWLPILYKKPWIILADPGFHQKLVDLGFELYDEILDYSFDSDTDLERRASAIADNIKRISEQNVDELYAIIKPKAQRNYDNYIRILTSPDYVPEVIKQRAKHAKNTEYKNKTYTDGRYVHICEGMGII